MQRADGGDHAVVQVAPEHERPGHPIKLLDHARRVRAGRVGNDATLDPGVALPLAALHDKVFLQHAQAAGQRTGIAVRAQSHVDAEDVAVFGHVGQCVDQTPAQLREVLVVGQRTWAALRVAIVVVQKDQVDVGRDVQLAPTKLAHADHHQLLHLARGLPDRLAVQRLQLLADHGDGRTHGKLGQIRHAAGHFIERSGAGQIALDERGEHFVAQQAQCALERGLGLHGRGVEQLGKARRQPGSVDGAGGGSLHTLSPTFARLCQALDIAGIGLRIRQRNMRGFRRTGRGLQERLGRQGGIGHAGHANHQGSCEGSVHSR